ncbi:MAG: cell envelope integrity EipB family protein [Rhodospirillales bacterium]|nr:cell envelope integrity EipB family protein [Rhodospirillales bacterium]
MRRPSNKNRELRRALRGPSPAAAFVFCLFLAAGSTAEAAGDLVGHQAIYRITLETASAGSGVVDASGAVLYRFADACDGWTVENRTALRLILGEDAETTTEWAYASWEAKDGSAFRFRVRDSQDGDLIEELRGNAELGSIGAPGRVDFSRPEQTAIDLPAGTMFPTDHLQRLFKLAQAGKHTSTDYMFDGASLENPYRVGAVFGPAPNSIREDLAARTGLGDLPVWTVRLAFFPVAEEGAVPKFEVGLHYREDGIADVIEQDFGDFVLRLTMAEFELLPEPGC